MIAKPVRLGFQNLGEPLDLRAQIAVLLARYDAHAAARLAASAMPSKGSRI